MEQRQNQAVLKQFPGKNPKGTWILAGAIFLVTLLGVGTGWLLSGAKGKGAASNMESAPGAKSTSGEAGLNDELTFRDTAEGTLEEGGIEGEGTHHLVREGGPSKSVYLTSTVIDLQSFAGKKVQVWGETISARKAGWLMDVGRVEELP